MIGWIILTGIVVAFLFGASRVAKYVPDEWVMDHYWDDEEDDKS